MKKFFLTTLCLILMRGLLLPTHAQWTYYNSYQKAIDAVQCGDNVYGLYEGGSLLCYDTTTEEVTFMDKSTGLSGGSIMKMDYNAKYHSLILIYNDGNVDLINTQSGRLSNMPQYQQNPDPTITINNLWTEGEHALIATGEGVLHLNVGRQEVRGYYRLGATKAARCVDNVLYAQLADGSILSCAIAKNPLDKSNWQVQADNKLPGSQRDNREAMGIIAENLTAYGPAVSSQFALSWKNGRLYVAGSRMDATDRDHHPFGAMTYEDGEWSNLAFNRSDDAHPEAAAFYRDANGIVEDPFDPTHLFITSVHLGLLEYKDKKFVQRFGHGFSPLITAAPGFPGYTRTSAPAFDKNGDLWFTNLSVDSVLVCRHRDGSWNKYYFEALDGCSECDCITFDSDGRLWLADKRFAGSHRGGVFCYDPATGKNLFRSTFMNEDGTTYTMNECRYITADHDGALWIGTDIGLFVVLDPSEWFNDDFLMLQIKVPRNDGTNYADYLLNGASISCIAVDGADRKWIGTTDNGVYLVSADGLETIHHFNIENSPLPSNNIRSIAIDHTNGRVYMSTPNGMVSYAGDATAPVSTLDKSMLHIFPNPLRPEHPRRITIQGLTADAEVKISTLNGQVVHTGTSIGGSYQWDATDLSGTPCASGVYLVLVSDGEGHDSVAGRLTIVR